MPETIRSVLFTCGQPIFPAGWGGAETCVHDLLAALTATGTEVHALGATPRGEASRVRHRLESYFGGPSLTPQGPYRYEVGYPCEIVPGDQYAETLQTLLERARPDVVLTQALEWPQVVAVARRHRVASILYVHGPEVLKIEMPARGADKVLYNSEFTRAWLDARFPYAGDVFYPPTDLARHRVESPGPGGALTLVNPLGVKGGDLLLPLARALPDRRFLAVEGWILPPFLARSLAREPNIEVIPWQHDMRRIYARTAVLLAPSLFEPFGRAPVEAAACGIPCVSSGVGGLREAMGPEGLYVDAHAPVEAWVDVVRRLEDPAEYGAQSRRCAQWAERFDARGAAVRFRHIAADVVARYIP